MPISETHVSSPPGASTRAAPLAPAARGLSFTVYQSDTFVNAWILANVLGALSVLCADTGVSAAEFATWAIFLLGNCGLLKRVITNSDDARAKAGPSLDALTAIAVIFGLLWAWPLHWAIGGGELPQAFTIMIGGGVVLLALPLFAPRGAAYFALLAGFCAALGALFLAHGVARWSIGGLLAFLLPTVIMARLYRALIANVDQCSNMDSAQHHPRCLKVTTILTTRALSSVHCAISWSTTRGCARHCTRLPTVSFASTRLASSTT